VPADITVRVGAALDRSVDVVFSNLESRARRFQETQGRAVNARPMGAGKVALNLAAEQLREQEKMNRLRVAEQAKTERTLAVQARQLSRERTKEKLSALSIEERAQREHDRRMERLAIASENRRSGATRREQRAKQTVTQYLENDRLATRTSHRALQHFTSSLGYGKRLATDLARGAGVDMSLSGGVSRGNEREAAAIALSNQGWIPGKDEKGVEHKFEDRISAASLRGTAGEVADKYKIDETDILGGMSKFTDVTGDLKTAQETIGMIALLSRASGTAIEDAASAAADMSMQLGDIPDKANVLAKLMGVAAMGGKQGAVEMKDLAKYVPQIAAYAGAMTGDKAENIGKLLAITQTARQYGGAGNAAIAATATAGLMNTLQTPGRVKEFEGHFKQFTGDRSSLYNEKGQTRPIDEIILDSIKAAGTGKYRQVEFKKMWANVKGGKAATGFMNIYDQAEEQAAKSDKEAGRKHVVGVAGEAAYKAQFSKFTAGMTPEDQAKLAASATSAKEAKAQDFQRKLDMITESMSNNLIPVLDKLAPKLLQLANAFSGAVTWAAANPWGVVMAALAVSAGRAGFESVGRLLMDRMVGSITGSGGLSAPVSSITGAGAVGATLGLATIAVASFAITSAVLNAATVSMQEDTAKRARNYNETFQNFTKGYSEAKTPEEREAAIKNARANVALTHESRGSVLNQVSTDTDMQKTLDAIAGFVRQQTSTGEQPWAPGDLRASAPKQISAEEIGSNLGIALKNTELRISGWDKFVEMVGGLSGGGGSSGNFGGPPRVNQSGP
jgi:hypothetical protein